MTFDTDRALLLHVLKGNEAAVALCEHLSSISQVWDDLIDKDVHVAPERITDAFYAALLELPLNPFYQAYQPRLLAQLQSVIFDWLSANRLEKSLPLVAYTLRDSFAGFVVLCAGIIGGREWAIHVSTEIRDYVHDEDYEGYLKEHGHG